MDKISSEPRARPGRQPSTSHAELSHIALAMFVERGFEATTIDDIVTAAGIGRRTFFRYFASKNDLPWGEFDELIARMRAYLAAIPTELPLIEALKASVIEFNRFPPEEIPYHRQRMKLILTNPTLVAHSTLRYEEWRRVISDFVASRLGIASNRLEPQAMAWALLGVSISAYEQWLQHDDSDLTQLLEAAYDMLSTSFVAGRPA
ncbi:putative transcriptional regulatory protein TetR [Microbacterium murale]|uniref:Transcriptional regulatory protein TetR n=2 Tax=Microbacterium murale TaxID=1081040 RepID=A0ABQ1RH22_9MICO|nr:putative transcriptional regulatory protein TetR [Microbacterium murale]